MKKASETPDTALFAYAQKYAERLQSFINEYAHTLPDEHSESIKRVISTIERRLIALKYTQQASVDIDDSRSTVMRRAS